MCADWEIGDHIDGNTGVRYQNHFIQGIRTGAVINQIAREVADRTAVVILQRRRPGNRR